MKTIKQWFEQAKEQGYEWAEAALQYTENHAKKFPEELVADSLQDAVADGFIWDKTDEKQDYWFEVYKTLR